MFISPLYSSNSLFCDNTTTATFTLVSPPTHLLYTRAELAQEKLHSSFQRGIKNAKDVSKDLGYTADSISRRG